MKKTGFILAACLLFSVLTSTAFALSADTVLSHDIKEADDTTGQDTNTGAGIKTGHIQNSAVTTSKVADNAVTNQKLGDGSVTDSKISGVISGAKLGAHVHSGADILDASISGAKVSDGAITDAKISGQISASKISSTGLNADTVDGLHAADLAPAVHVHGQSQVTGLEAALAGKSDVAHNHDVLYQQKYGKIAVVAQTGGDYADPIAAMDNVSAWCGTPSAANPCLVKVMPGIYDIGTNSFWLQSYIDIEGSGADVTKIIGRRAEYNQGGLFRDWTGSAVVVEISKITVENSGEGDMIAMYFNNYNPATIYKLRDMTVTASATGSAVGIWGYGGHTLSLTNVTVKAASTGYQSVAVFGQGSIRIVNGDISATGGTFAYAVNEGGGSSTIVSSTLNAAGVVSNAINMTENVVSTLRNSEILNGSIYGDYYGGNAAKANVVSSKISGIGGVVVVKCVNAYDADYNPVTCP